MNSQKFTSSSQNVSKKGSKKMHTTLKIHREFIGLCFSDDTLAHLCAALCAAKRRSGRLKGAGNE
jgi:hypothetical protein